MADKKISQLSSASTPLAGTEVLPIVQSSATVKVATDDLTVKNVRSNATTGILQIAGPGAGTTRVMTVPNANFTAARIDAGQTFAGVQKFSSQAQAEATSATTWSATALNTDTFRSTNLSATANSFTAFGYQVTNSDGSAGYATTAAIASGSFSADWVVQNRNAGNFQENFRVKAAGDVTVNTGNLVVGTAGKGVTTSSATALGFGTNNSTTQATLDTSGNLVATGAIAGNNVYSYRGSTAYPTASVATTIFTMPSDGLYQVYFYLAGANDEQYSAFTFAVKSGSSTRLFATYPGALLTISLSGSDIQATHAIAGYAVSYSVQRQI